MNEKTILTLIDTFSSGDVAELDLNDGTIHLILRKAEALNWYPLYGAAKNAPYSNLPAPRGELITSPQVAVFYAAPAPGEPPLVPGSRVKAGAPLCVLETLDEMTPLKAEFDGKILSVLVKDGDPVEFGQALFEVKRLQRRGP
jgi:acetyl-CoA carboxylase biotin carboxyl carrier protein